MADNVHEKHRERVRKEFLENGINENTPAHKILEHLLFYCIPRIDTNPIAHQMIEKYGSISGVLDAPVEELADFKGMSERSAVLLKMIMPVARRYLYDKSVARKQFSSLDDIGKYILERYVGFTEEKAGILCLNAAGSLLGFTFISEGDISSVGISIRELIKIAIDLDATVVVLCHNHPSGIALPSGNDVALTEMAAQSLSYVGIRLLDHIITANGDFISMAQSSEYSHIFK